MSKQPIEEDENRDLCAGLGEAEDEIRRLRGLVREAFEEGLETGWIPRRHPPSRRAFVAVHATAGRDRNRRKGERVMWFVYCLAATGAVTLALGCYIWLQMFYDWCSDQVENWKRGIGIRYMRREMTQAADWFSEDLPTRSLLMRLGEGKSAQECRDRWCVERQSGTQRGNV